MSLPLPPKNAPIMPVGRLVHHKLPLPPLPSPPQRVDRNKHGADERIKVVRLGHDRLELTIDGVAHVIARTETCRLIGYLEREVTSL